MRDLMIEARWATYIADDLRRAGHALDGPLKEVGLSRTDVARPDGRIPYAAYMGLIERAALLLDEPGYGLKLGISHGVRDSGLVGFVALNSPTLGDALANVERYISVTNEGLDVVFEALGSGGALRFREFDGPMRGLRHHAEQASALLVKGAREMTDRKAAPLCVEFMHGRPNAAVDYERLLGCPVRFQAAWDAVVFSQEALELPVVGADNRLLRVLEGACRRILGRRPRKDDLVHSVREYVVKRLKNGAPPFDDVARDFNMSSKTLERRLAGHHASYRDLVDDIRCDLAKHLLANTDVRLHQIAYTLGYSEPGPLVRAFKRWADETPMQYRRKHRP
jgi:AraC-like DNA-binding protein